MLLFTLQCEQQHFDSFRERKHRCEMLDGVLVIIIMYRGIVSVIAGYKEKIRKAVNEMKLYIIRHGETSWNKEKKLQGRKDIMLDADGIRLAELTGEGMKDIDFDLVISSPLIRAKQTAELVMAGRQLPMITDKRMIEMSFGKWEGESVRNSTVLPADYVD